MQRLTPQIENPVIQPGTNRPYQGNLRATASVESYVRFLTRIQALTIDAGSGREVRLKPRDWKGSLEQDVPHARAQRGCQVFQRFSSVEELELESDDEQTNADR